MRITGTIRFAFPIALFAIGCENDAHAPAAGAWQENECARVASASIACAEVDAVMSRQSRPAREAASMLADDVRIALALADNRVRVSEWTRRVVLARATIRGVENAANAITVPTDEEIAELSAARWAEFDRPESVRVIHAIAMRPKNGSFASARELAGKLREAVEAATSDDDFEARARALPHGNVDTRVERLPPFAADGRVTAEGVGGEMVAPFASAATKLQARGEMSPVVETDFGFHVIRLIERIPSYAMPMDERRLTLAESARGLRAKKSLQEIIDRQKKKKTIDIDPSAEVSIDGVLRAFSSQ